MTQRRRYSQNTLHSFTIGQSIISALAFDGCCLRYRFLHTVTQEIASPNSMGIKKLLEKAEEIASKELQKQLQKQQQQGSSRGQAYAPPVVLQQQPYAPPPQWTPPPSPPPYSGSVFAGRPSTPPAQPTHSLQQQQQPSPVVNGGAVGSATPQQQSDVSQPSTGLSASPSTASRGRKKALLVACSYPGTKHQLRGPSNDIQCMQVRQGLWCRLATATTSMQQRHRMPVCVTICKFCLQLTRPSSCSCHPPPQYLLTNKLGFSPSQIVVLRDDDFSRGRDFVPTRDVVLRACSWLISDARPGDSLFFHYSGHGGRMKDPTCRLMLLLL